MGQVETAECNGDSGLSVFHELIGDVAEADVEYEHPYKTNHKGGGLAGN